MSHLILSPSSALVMRPGGVNPELPTKPFPSTLQRWRNKLTRPKLPAVTALALALFILAAALPQAALAAPGTWSLAPPLATARYGHTATLLPNGNVLVAGGENATDSVLASAEIYDPLMYYMPGATWLNTIPMYSPRKHHTATLLNSGQVLVVGGERLVGGSPVFVYGTEYYEPKGWWVTAGYTVHNPRTNFTSTLVNANVAGSIEPCLLSVGGMTYENYQRVPTATAELFAGGTRQLPPMSVPRTDHTATLLRDGRVLAVGGLYINSTNAEIFDPVALTWTTTPPINSSGTDHTATLLPNGKVLVVGGIGNIAELYDPASGTWSLTNPPIVFRRSGHTATLLPNGLVLVAGGGINYTDSKTAELYDPATETWFPTGNLNFSRSEHTATLLNNGNVLVAGGLGPGGEYLTSAELYEPEPRPKLPPLLGFYPFDTGNAGDFSGHRRHGTVVGSPPLIQGYEGAAYYFGNHNGYIIIPLNINPDKYPRLTMGAWVKTVSSASLQTILTHDDGGYDRSIGIDYRGGGTGWSAFCGSGQVLGAAPAIQQAWTFVAVVYDQVHQTVKLRVDDTVLTKDAAVLSQGQNQLFIGLSPLFGNFFDGIIDNVFVFGDALTDKQLAYIRYGGAKAIMTAPRGVNTGFLQLLLGD
jgi:hypothetical protein